MAETFIETVIKVIDENVGKEAEIVVHKRTIEGTIKTEVSNDVSPSFKIGDEKIYIDEVIIMTINGKAYVKEEF